MLEAVEEREIISELSGCRCHVTELYQLGLVGYDHLIPRI